MIASLNDVSAFDVIKKSSGDMFPLQPRDPCATCLRKGYTYVYDKASKSIQSPKYFHETAVGAADLAGKCCLKA